MATNARQDSPGWGYAGAAAMLLLAFLFPMGLMIFDPTLMFERGWEQYVGTGIYFWAVLTLSRELLRLWKNEQAFRDAPRMLKRLAASVGSAGGGGASASAADPDAAPGILTDRVRQLTGCLNETARPSVTQLMEVNRESSGLDQEQMAGRFTLTRYILYLLPVIGFIGTVEGISRALMNISRVLPMVKNLDGFLTNLTSVTAALQIAFDSTLLALFLSAALMLVQTLVFRRSEDLLARVDRWVVDHVLPRVSTENPLAERLIEVIGPQLDEMGNKLAMVIEPAVRSLHEQAEKLGESLRGPDRAVCQRGGAAAGRHWLLSSRGPTPSAGSAPTSRRSGRPASRCARSSTSLRGSRLCWPSGRRRIPELEEIKLGLDRTGAAIESLAGSWSAAYERSSRATQEQLAHSLTSLKDALELLNVSMEQGNALYRSIVKKLFDERAEPRSHRAEPIRVA